MIAWSCLAALAGCGRLEYAQTSLDAGFGLDAFVATDAQALDAFVTLDAPIDDAGSDAGPPADGGGCATGTYGGHDYALCGAELIWSDARAACESMGMHLARIDDAGEQAFLEAIAPTDRAWIGANDLPLEGTWEWLDGAIFYVHAMGGGTSVGYTHWGSAEPNGALRESCAAIVTNGFWVDFPCDLGSSFVCERP